MLKNLLIPIKFIWHHPVTKNNKLSGLFRFILWQIKANSKSTAHVVNWMGGLKLSVSKGMHGATGCIYVGLPEFRDMAFLLHFLKPDNQFIDIGSNVGVYTLLASGICKCNSICVEPIPQTFNYLKENIKVNGLENRVISLNIGLSYEKGNLFFTKDGDTVNHVVDARTDQTVTVPVDILDHIVNDEISADLLIKLDVEGFEYNVLKGAKHVLQNTHLKAIIVELNGCSERYSLNDGMVDELLINNGFEKFDYDPFQRTLTKINAFHKEENTLYLRSSCVDEIKQKVKEAQPFTVFNQNI